jgi:hypothetical protein
VTPSLAAIGQADQTWHVRPEDPFATADRLPEGINSDQVSRFGDQRWNYTVLSRRRTEGSKTVNWAAFPETLRESFRRAGWALVNLPTPRCSAASSRDRPRRMAGAGHHGTGVPRMAALRRLARRP